MTPSRPIVDARSVRATFDGGTVLVWQAHAPAVAAAALAHGGFRAVCWAERATRFRLSLPALLARNGWGTRPGRECVLGVRITREGFDALLRQAVHEGFEPAVYPSRNAWHLARRHTNVSIAWHPDVDLAGDELASATLRVELRDHALGRFVRDWVVGVEDWTSRIAEHRDERACLRVPPVAPYPVAAADAARLAGQRCASTSARG